MSKTNKAQKAAYDKLYKRVASVPLQTLQSHTLNEIKRLRSANSGNKGDGEDLDVLTRFFAKLYRPPTLHCVRCHQSYVEVENDDRSCVIDEHDPDNVDFVQGTGWDKYDTVWRCCERRTEGYEGSEPDEPCFEGRHTVTDILLRSSIV